MMTLERETKRKSRAGIPVRIREFNLIGGGSPDPSESVQSFFDIVVQLDTSQLSMGQITDLSDPPGIADSFFDIFIELQLPALGGETWFHADTSVHLVAQPAFSPFLERRFVSDGSVHFSPEGNSVLCGIDLTQMTYVPVSPSAAIIKRELIQLEKKLDHLLTRIPPPLSCDGTNCP
jgi:hypothetical protein